MFTDNYKKIIFISYFIFTALLLSYLVSSVKIRSDMSFFVAENMSDTDRIIQQYLTKGDANRLLFIQLTNKEKIINSRDSSKELAHFSNQLRDKLIKNEHFILVENGQQTIKQTLDSQLYQYRYLISPEFDSSPNLLSVNSLKHHFKLLQERLHIFASRDEQKLIAESPLNVWFRYLKSINSTQLIKKEGVWFNEHEQAILLLKTKEPGFALNQQKENILFIQEQIKQILPPDISYTLSGAAVIALNNSDKIAFQIKIISTSASIILMFFLFLFFRSIRLVLLISLPLFFAVLVGTSMVNLFYGYIHGISLAFGITIIGVAVDYPIHYFSYLRGDQKTGSFSHNRAVILKIWPKLKLGLITTLIGFSAITFSDFSGLNQLGIFAISGLLTAALSTRYLLPLFDYKKVNHNEYKIIHWCTHFLNFKNQCYFRYLVSILLLIAVSYIATHDHLWENDLASLSPVSNELKQRDFKLRKSLNLPELRYLLLISADSEQKILEKTEEVSPFLEQLITSGAISFYDSASRYIPSIRTQMQRQKKLLNKEQLHKNLTNALSNSSFNVEAFRPFISAVDENKQLSPLTPDNLDDALFSAKIKSLIFSDKEAGKNKWIGLIFLSGVDGKKLDVQFKQYVHHSSLKNTASQTIKLIDIKQQTNNLIKGYRIEAIHWFLWGSLFIVLFLFFYIKKISSLPALILPFSGAVIFTISLLLFFGYSLSIFHLVTLLLVVGLGIDYSIFIYNYDLNTDFNDNLQTITLFSVLVCTISSIIMFFSLSLSSIPVLKAIGLTASLGASLAFILSLIFSRSCKST